MTDQKRCKCYLDVICNFSKYVSGCEHNGAVQTPQALSAEGTHTDNICIAIIMP